MLIVDVCHGTSTALGTRRRSRFGDTPTSSFRNGAEAQDVARERQYDRQPEQEQQQRRRRFDDRGDVDGNGRGESW